MISLLELGQLAPLIASASLAIGIIAALVAARQGLQLFWEQLTARGRERISDVIRYVFGERFEVIDTISLILFAECALAVVLFKNGLSPGAILVLLFLAMALPYFFFRRAAGKRAQELEMALPMALQQVANEMAAGATLETALKKVAKSAPAPADVEIARLQRRVEIKGIDAAFCEMADRLDSRSFAITAAVVRVGTSSGGQLVAALKNLSRTLIEIERLNRKLRTASENGRRNIYLMSVIGPLIAIGSSMAVEHQHSVMEDGFGQVLIGISVLSFFASHVIGFALTKVKV